MTPAQVPKRYTTQMYLYFLPLSPSLSTTSSTGTPIPTSHETVIPPPTHDGGIEHTAARFQPAATWLAAADSGSIILYPPQYTLLHLVSRFLPPSSSPQKHHDLAAQRTALLEFARGGEPPWAEVVTSPASEGRAEDGREVLSMRTLPPELVGSGRKGIAGLVLLVRMTKGGFRELEVRERGDVPGLRKKEGANM